MYENITHALSTDKYIKKLSSTYISGRNKGPELVGHFLKIGHFVGY